MNTRKLLHPTILIIALCMINQFASAQPWCPTPQTCAAGKVWACRYNHQCQIESKCINANNVASWQAHGEDICHCNPCGYYRLENTNVDLTNSLEVYPMPVSNATTISFYLLQSEKVSLKIFDVNGRLITTLADKNYDAGKNELIWNADEINAGIYFLQFQSTEKLQTEKLIVTK